MQAQPASAHGIDHQVIRRAWSDPGFKDALLNDPRSAVASLGYELPDGVQLKVIEETDDTRYLVLPASPRQAMAGHLEDGDLGSAACRPGRTTHQPPPRGYGHGAQADCTIGD